MLRAIVHKKTRLHLRYLGHREEDERRVPAEDEITSNFFDGLALLDAPDVLKFWRKLLDTDQHASFLADQEPSLLEWKFWPRRWPGEGCIEPDMHLEFRWPGGETRSFLVELKWKSRMPERQLQDQWLKYLSDAERETSVHVFIGKDVSTAVAARAGQDVWKLGQLILRPWIEIRSAMMAIDAPSGPLRRWIDLADQLLERLQISRFSGIPVAEQRALGLRFGESCFWRGPYFFAGLSPSSGLAKGILSKPVPDSVFYSGK